MDFYETTSLYLAASLQATGAQFLGTAKIAAGKVAFRFADPDNTLRQWERSYKRDQAQPVQPRVLFHSLHLMRDELTEALAQLIFRMI